MAKDSYVVDEEDMKEEKVDEPVQEMKPTMCVKESDMKGITGKKLGDKVSLMVDGTIIEISKGYEIKPEPEVRLEIDSIKGGNSNG